MFSMQTSSFNSSCSLFFPASSLLSLTFFSLSLFPVCRYMSVPSSLVCLSLSLSLFFSPHGYAASVKPAISPALTPDLFWCLSLLLPLSPLPLFKVVHFLLQLWNLIKKHIHTLKQFVFSFYVCHLLIIFITCPCLLVFPFSSFFFPLWQSKQEPLICISASCCCYTQSCFEGRKSLILSTVQGSVLVPLIFLYPRHCALLSPLSPLSVLLMSCFPLSPSLTLFQGCSRDCFLSPSSLVL